jgi:hypothetical protein
LDANDFRKFLRLSGFLARMGWVFLLPPARMDVGGGKKSPVVGWVEFAGWL